MRLAMACDCAFSSASLDFHDLALALDVPLVAVGRRQRQLARQQVVARVAGGHFHDVAALAEVLDVLL